MSRRALALSLALCATAVAAGFFDIETVNEIRLYFTEPNWDDILDSLYAAGEEGRLTGTAVINGIRFDSVGVRYKGQSSYNPSRKKNPLNVKLDHVNPAQLIEGHGTLRLANVYKDPSFVREALSYEIARKYMPAGRANFANVWANDTLLGLYTNDEDPDRQFMRIYFLCDENARFKGRMLGTVVPAGWKYLGPDSTPYLVYYELDSDSGWRELIGFLDTLNNQNAELDRVLNVDRHLWMLAFDILMVNLDAPVNMPQNFYLYRDASARFNPIIWDLNENFGAFRDLEGTGQLSLAQMQQLDPFLRQADTQFPICSKVFPDARRRRMYVAHMKTMIAEALADGWYQDRACEIQDIVDTHVRADPNKFYSYNDFLNNITRSVGSGPLAIVGLTELMNPRVSYLLGRPEFQAAAPEIAELTVAPDRPAPGSEVRFTARVEGADSVFLGWRQIPATAFHKVRLLADGTAGDGLYSATFRLGTGTVEYYVYAENSEAGTFLPARAEHESFRLPVTGDVVLNEFMAINRTAVQDPSGEYDDWIELFNNRASPVSLDGWLLSDDTTDIIRWSFPDVSIPARGYLVVWADNDSGQPGLHAGFELAGSHGTLLLSDPDGRPQDRVAYGQQSADISYGRWPNGTGPFIFMNPTFETENDSGVGLAEPSATPLACRFERASPNPFARSTIVRYQLATRCAVDLGVYDAAGRLVARLVSGVQDPGSYDAVFAPATRAGLAAGVLFARLVARLDTDILVEQNVKLVWAGQLTHAVAISHHTGGKKCRSDSSYSP